MEVYVAYKSYDGFEDDDSNGADIIGVFKEYDDACKALAEEVKQDEAYFRAEDIKYETEILDTKLVVGYIATPIGHIEFSITKREVE